MSGRSRLAVSTGIRCRVTGLGAAVLLACPVPGGAYGPEGHLIAGRAAEQMLCARAADRIAELGGGDDLGELGLWADRIRGDDRYSDSAPWHYMNIATGESLAGYAHPPEGDILWAIDHFAARLVDAKLSDAVRGEALRFLVHFIVDIHQPLHVGLADDRGGNAIELRYGGRMTNLHRFWDTHAIEWADISIDEYVRGIRVPDRTDDDPARDPMVWAAESLDLRPAVYDFDGQRREPSATYKNFAAETTRLRLGQAALRLADTLNRLLCD